MCVSAGLVCYSTHAEVRGGLTGVFLFCHLVGRQNQTQARAVCRGLYLLSLPSPALELLTLYYREASTKLRGEGLLSLPKSP